MWDLPGSGIEPVSPVLTGEFFTIEPPNSVLYHPILNEIHLSNLIKSTR